MPAVTHRGVRGLLGVVTAAATVGALGSLRAEEPKRQPLAFVQHRIDTGLVWNSAVSLDVDGDGQLDVAAAGPEEVAWYQRTGENWSKTVILKRTPPTGSLDSITLVPYDLDGDKDPDLVTSCPGSGVLGWYENVGNGPGWVWHLIDKLPRIHSQALRDLDGDGRPELVANTDGKLVKFTVPADPRKAADAGSGQPEAQRWVRATLAEQGVEGTPHYLSFHQLGGKLVLCGAAPDAAYLAWWQRPQEGGLWTRRTIRSEFTGASHLIPCDMNGDRVTDLFYARGHTAGSGWLAGPEFTQDHAIDTGELKEPHALAVADLNGDGALDVAAAARNKGGLVAWVNDGRGRFTAQPLDPIQQGMDLRVGDLDGDGDQDLLFAGATGKNVTWYENRRK